MDKDKVISLDDRRDLLHRCKEEIEYYEDRLNKLEYRQNMLAEEVRQTEELIMILKSELIKIGGSK